MWIGLGRRRGGSNLTQSAEKPLSAQTFTIVVECGSATRFAPAMKTHHPRCGCPSKASPSCLCPARGGPKTARVAPTGGRICAAINTLVIPAPAKTRHSRECSNKSFPRTRESRSPPSSFPRMRESSRSAAYSHSRPGGPMTTDGGKPPRFWPPTMLMYSSDSSTAV